MDDAASTRGPRTFIGVDSAPPPGDRAAAVKMTVNADGTFVVDQIETWSKEQNEAAVRRVLDMIAREARPLPKLDVAPPAGPTFANAVAPPVLTLEAMRAARDALLRGTLALPPAPPMAPWLDELEAFGSRGRDAWEREYMGTFTTYAAGAVPARNYAWVADETPYAPRPYVPEDLRRHRARPLTAEALRARVDEAHAAGPMPLPGGGP